MSYSDSNYVAVTRHRRPFSLCSSSIAVLEIVDDEWAADCLSDDEIEVGRHEAAVAPLLEEGELDADAIVVSPTGNSASAANSAAERRQREEGWNDLGLDQLDSRGNWSAASSNNNNQGTPAGPNNAPQQDQQQQQQQQPGQG